MTLERKCNYCDRIFTPKHGNQKYCTYDCMINAKNERRNKLREADPEGKRQYDFEWRMKNKEHHTKQKAKYRDEIRRIVYNVYGRECVWCGQTYEPVLEFDHINNDGKKERARRSSKSMFFHIWEDRKKTGKWRTDIQVLCRSCNWAKCRNGGVLPLELKNQLRRKNLGVLGHEEATKTKAYISG